MEMKMVQSSSSDSFIGILDLENVGVEPKIVPLSRSQAEISLFRIFNSALTSVSISDIVEQRKHLSRFR
jgi:hypothetical protein